jgi:cyanophycinase
MAPELPAPVLLIGGGWDPGAGRRHYGALLAACTTPRPQVACVVLDEGDGTEQFGRWAGALTAAGPCEPVPVLVPEGGALDVAALGDADAVLVGGGLTPAYAAALAPAREALGEWLAQRPRPYAGFSAGSAIAATRAVVGGWRAAGVPVCPVDAGEDLEEVTVVDGLGLVPFSVDVHCAQWGTLPRLLSALTALSGPPGGIGVGLDENTMLTVAGGTATVSGSGHAWLTTSTAEGVTVRALAAGEGFPVPEPA